MSVSIPMAGGESEAKKKNGYSYLMDANNSRQYGIRFTNGQPHSGVNIFAANGDEAALKPNEVVYAFDDQTLTTFTAFEGKLSTTMCEIKAGLGGKPSTMKTMDCEYDVTFTADGKGVRVEYALTPASVTKLEGFEFSDRMPRKYSVTLDEGFTVEQKGISIAPATLRNLAFPPHHAGGARLARAGLETPESATTEFRYIQFRETLNSILERLPIPVFIQNKTPDNVIEVFKPLSLRKAAFEASRPA